jgi:hypothetical protein
MPIYTFTTFNDPSASAGTTQAFGINDSDQIVGQYKSGTITHGFLESGDTFTCANSGVLVSLARDRNDMSNLWTSSNSKSPSYSFVISIPGQSGDIRTKSISHSNSMPGPGIWNAALANRTREARRGDRTGESRWHACPLLDLPAREAVDGGGRQELAEGVGRSLINAQIAAPLRLSKKWHSPVLSIRGIIQPRGHSCADPRPSRRLGRG